MKSHDAEAGAILTERVDSSAETELMLWSLLKQTRSQAQSACKSQLCNAGSKEENQRDAETQAWYGKASSKEEHRQIHQLLRNPNGKATQVSP